MDVEPPCTPGEQPPRLTPWLCRWPDVWTSSLTSLCLRFPVCEMGTTQGVPTAGAVGRTEWPPAGVTRAAGRRAVRGRAGVACCCPRQDRTPSAPRVSPSILSPLDFCPVLNSEGAHWLGHGGCTLARPWSLDSFLPCWERGSRSDRRDVSPGRGRRHRLHQGPAERRGHILPLSHPQEPTLSTPWWQTSGLWNLRDYVSVV